MTNDDPPTPPGAFAWPPRPAAPEYLPAPGLTRRRPTPSTFQRTSPPSLLDAVEREWLDITSEPVARRIARGDWRPDAMEAYCRKCGRSIGPHEDDGSGCSVCRGTRPPWSRMVRLGPHEGLLRDMIVEVKFTRFRRLGQDLGRLLGDAIAAAAAQDGVNLDETVVVPVPTTVRRRLARGIDHTAVIAAAAAEALGAPLIKGLARRHVPSQLTLAPSRRAANVAGTMRSRRGAAAKLAGKTVLVIDDVCTTGATMRAACRALRGGGQDAACRPREVWAAVLARAELQ